MKLAVGPLFREVGSRQPPSSLVLKGGRVDVSTTRDQRRGFRPTEGKLLDFIKGDFLRRTAFRHAENLPLRLYQGRIRQMHRRLRSDLHARVSGGIVRI